MSPKLDPSQGRIRICRHCTVLLFCRTEKPTSPTSKVVDDVPGPAPELLFRENIAYNMLMSCTHGDYCNL
jgi:hypothetical protein